MTVFRTNLFLLIILFCCLSSAHAFVVLIDPGHGGEDTGAQVSVVTMKKGKRVVSNLFEKDLSLQISNRLLRILRSRKYKAYLTRSYDRTVTLEARANMADKISADLFISIHINSSLKKSSRGIETYYLDNHDDVAVKKVEDVENKALKGEDLIVQKILIDLVVKRTVESSKRLARWIHNFINKGVIKKYKTKDRGVRPGLFYVLALSKRPAALLEAGFLSNIKEAKLISSDKFQESYAKAVANGIDKYFLKQQKKSGPSLF